MAGVATCAPVIALLVSCVYHIGDRGGPSLNVSCWNIIIPLTVLRTFIQKAYPKRSNAEEKELKKSLNSEININTMDSGNNEGGLPSQEKYNSRSPLKAIFKKETSKLNVNYKGINSSGMNEKREQWIKTDADFLVLEVQSSRS